MAIGTTIWLARHGEVHNPTNVLYGRLPRVDLTPEGRRQAHAIAEWLRKRGGLEADFSAMRQAPPPDMFEEFSLVPDRFLVDGERPLGPGTDLLSVWTPGHTPGHVCFADTVRDVVLTGDHILPRITPNISPAPDDTDDLLGQYLV